MENIFDKQRQSIYYELKKIGLEEQECHAEADIILEHVTNLKRTQQITSNLEHFKSNWLRDITRILDARRERKPLAYCLGEVEFAGLMLKIVPGVLIPRVDTETLVETIIARLRKNDNPRTVGAGIYTRPFEVTSCEEIVVASRMRAQQASPLQPALEHRPIHIADIGVGCGAIAVSLLKRLPESTVWGCDISEIVIATTLGNARRHNVHDRLTLVHGDWKKVLPNNFDIIVSNPPYLPLSLEKNLQPEIAFEPKTALFDGSEDGLSFYREFAEKLPGHFAECGEQGFAAFEIGDNQEQAILEIFKQNGWRNLHIQQDINALARILIAYLPQLSTKTDNEVCCR